MNEPPLTVHVTPIGHKLSELAEIDQIKSNYNQAKKQEKAATPPIEKTAISLPSEKLSEKL